LLEREANIYQPDRGERHGRAVELGSEQARRAGGDADADALLRAEQPGVAEIEAEAAEGGRNPASSLTGLPPASARTGGSVNRSRGK